MSLDKAKKQLDIVIKKPRIHFYKPIQIAEVLFKNRSSEKLARDLSILENYRTVSRRWRDEQSLHIVGRISTSSARYQDDIWNKNAMPPDLLVKLAKYNMDNGGIVEAYIYSKIQQKHQNLFEIYTYIRKADKNSFNLNRLISMFIGNVGLIRSMDKVFEITVYALFLTLTRELDVSVELKIGTDNIGLIKEFEDFSEKVFGLSSNELARTLPAFVYRVGATNAADRGLDMWSSFGAAIQVKHLTLDEELLEDIASDVTADRLVIVCKEAESKVINYLFSKTGARSKVQAIVTFEELDDWYEKCLTGSFSVLLSEKLLLTFRQEFEYEFPFVGDYLEKLSSSRGYNKLDLEGY